MEYDAAKRWPGLHKRLTSASSRALPVSFPRLPDVTPKLPAASLSELEHGAHTSLGPTLAAATRAIEVVIRPERVYCALFAEETRSIHFHLFPRTAWLLSQYGTVHPADREISGPRLLDWARRTFHRPISTDYTETVEAIFRELDLAVSER